MQCSNLTVWMLAMGAAPLIASQVIAAPVTTSSVSAPADAHAEVAAVLYAASATQAALAKSLDVKLRGQQERIAALAAEVKAGDVRHRAEMIAAQESFVRDLAAKDREYAVQLEVFRSAVTDIASTPQGAEALERFNAGDEVGAIDILDKLRATNERMREARAKLEDAAAGRRIAQLALEARTRGKVTTNAVITRFEEVVRLDPGVWSDWLELDHLYQDAGRLDDARKAVDQLVAIARNGNETARAFSERSDVLLALGDLVGSRKAAENAVVISRRSAAADPKDVELAYTLSNTIISFGEVARRQADFSAAQKAYLEAVGMARSRVAADPSNSLARRTLGSALLHLADILIQLGNISGARSALEENLGIQEREAAESPDNIVNQRHIAVTLMWLSDVLVSEGAFADARKANARIVETAGRLSAADPANAILQRDLAYGYSKTALLQRIEGDFDGSLQNYGRVLEITRALSLRPTAALDVRQDVGTSLNDIGTVKYLKGDVEGSRQANEEGVVLLRKLATADPTDATTRHFLAATLYGLGSALAAKSDFTGARKAFDEGIALDQALVAKSVDAADIEYGISIGQLEIGRLLNQQGDRAGALASLQKSLDIRRRQARARPGNSSAERGVAEVMYALANVPGSKVGWADFRAQVEGMDNKGILWPADRAWLDEGRSRATRGEKS